MTSRGTISTPVTTLVQLIPRLLYLLNRLSFVMISWDIMLTIETTNRIIMTPGYVGLCRIDDCIAEKEMLADRIRLQPFTQIKLPPSPPVVHDNLSCINNLLPPRAAYLRQWIGCALVQLMPSRLFGATSLLLKNAGLFSIRLLWTNLSEIRTWLLSFSFNKWVSNCSLPKWLPFFSLWRRVNAEADMSAPGVVSENVHVPLLSVTDVHLGRYGQYGSIWCINNFLR